MQIRQANAHELEKALILAHRTTTDFQFLDANDVSFQNGVLSVDLINGDPYIVDLTDGNVYTFVSEPGSGTDHLRKRMEKRLFEQELISNRNRPAHYLDAQLTEHRVQEIEQQLEHGPVVVGLDRLVNRGGSIELYLAHTSEPIEFKTVEAALTHIVVREQGEEGVADRTWPRPRN